nr:MAG TPA: hypothetical protein [Crassvirales sp.]
MKSFNSCTVIVFKIKMVENGIFSVTAVARI